MTYPRSIIRDDNGRVMDFGSTKTVIEHTSLFGAGLPAGWGTSNSATSIASPAVDAAAVAHDVSNDGYFRVGTSVPSTTSGDIALLYGPLLQMSRFGAAHFEMMGLYWNDAYVSTLAAHVRIGLRSIDTASAGADASQLATDPGSPTGPATQFRLPGVSGQAPEDARYEMRTSGEASKRRHIGFLLVPGTSEMALTEGGLDNIVAWRRDPDMISGAVRPMAQISAQEDARKAFRFTGFRLTVWQH